MIRNLLTIHSLLFRCLHLRYYVHPFLRLYLKILQYNLKYSTLNSKNVYLLQQFMELDKLTQTHLQEPHTPHLAKLKADHSSRTSRTFESSGHFEAVRLTPHESVFIEFRLAGVSNLENSSEVGSLAKKKRLPIILLLNILFIP